MGFPTLCPMCSFLTLSTFLYPSWNRVDPVTFGTLIPSLLKSQSPTPSAGPPTAFLSQPASRKLQKPSSASPTHLPWTLSCEHSGWWWRTSCVFPNVLGSLWSRQLTEHLTREFAQREAWRSHRTLLDGSFFEEHTLLSVSL